jgi:hypothetical protein
MPFQNALYDLLEFLRSLCGIHRDVPEDLVNQTGEFFQGFRCGHLEYNQKHGYKTVGINERLIFAFHTEPVSPSSSYTPDRVKYLTGSLQYPFRVISRTTGYQFHNVLKNH